MLHQHSTICSSFSDWPDDNADPASYCPGCWTSALIEHHAAMAIQFNNSHSGYGLWIAWRALEDDDYLTVGSAIYGSRRTPHTVEWGKAATHGDHWCQQYV